MTRTQARKLRPGARIIHQGVVRKLVSRGESPPYYDKAMRGTYLHLEGYGPNIIQYPDFLYAVDCQDCEVAR